MNQKTVHFQMTNTLINSIKNKDNIKILKKTSTLAKIFTKKKYADIYFHSGNLDDYSIDYIKNAKFTIVNSFSMKNLVLAKTKVNHEKVQVIYPSVKIEYKKPKELKKIYIEKFNLSTTTKLILFTAKNFKTNGIKEFLDIASNLSYMDFRLLIVGSKQQLAALDFILAKYSKLEDKISKLANDNVNLDELFLISDIFLLPTHNKTIASNVIKAMFCKCVVFSTINNDVKEIIDIFATMERPNDPSTPFKIDAILYDENELKKIKKQNRKIALEMSLDKNLEKFNNILDKI